MVAVPLWLSAKVTPVGREPTSVRVGVTTTDVVTVKLKGTPCTTVVLDALVNVGA